MLRGKTVVLGITGGIAAYKMANTASALVKLGADVHVIMTENAQNFITPNTFEALCHRRCITDTFDRNHEFEVEHVGLAKSADIILIAPATANVIGKMANGIADDMLTTTVLAAKCPILVAPAMNTGMYENQIVQDNMEKLSRYGFQMIEPVSGYLACGDVGAGKMVEPEVLVEYILREVAMSKDLHGKKILITAGATREALDPVRFMTNHSTGKMGYAFARVAAMRGAEVTLVSGQTNLGKPVGVRVVDVVSAQDMYEAVMEWAPTQDIVIKAAAVADYRPKEVHEEKTKKKAGDLSIALERTTDILKTLGAKKREGQFLCGFSMETENLIENSRDKLERKNLDMIVANNLKVDGAGFGGDTNVVTIITKDMEKSLPTMSKEDVANEILNEIMHKSSN